MMSFWDAVGPSDSDVISYLINPQFQGKPAWPNTRQAYRVVRPPEALIITSDGLSDPFVDTDMDNVNGFGMEVFVETPDLVGASFDAIRTSWAFRVIENFAMNVADWGGISANLRADPILSVEFPSEGILPADWLTTNATAGFLINVPIARRASEVAMPLGNVLIVPLTLLRPSELKVVVEKGRAGRCAVADALRENGYGHVSSLDRPSVV
jgi:hypothetical protein